MHWAVSATQPAPTPEFAKGLTDPFLPRNVVSRERLEQCSWPTWNLTVVVSQESTIGCQGGS